MLDTNICSYIIRNKPIYIKEILQEKEKTYMIALSSIVVSELLYGAIKKDSSKLYKIVSTFIDNFVIYDYSKVSAVSYANVRVSLENRGNIIGANDLLIASHALSLKAILVTNNTKEFERVDELELENWI